jgi:hypothetical protein
MLRRNGGGTRRGGTNEATVSVWHPFEAVRRFSSDLIDSAVSHCDRLASAVLLRGSRALAQYARGRGNVDESLSR